MIAIIGNPVESEEQKDIIIGNRLHEVIFWGEFSMVRYNDPVGLRDQPGSDIKVV